MERTPLSLRHGALGATSDEVEQVRDGDDSGQPSTLQDRHAPNDTTTEFVGRLPYGHVAVGRDHWRSHQFLDRLSSTDVRPSDTSDVSIRDHSHDLPTAHDDEVVNSVFAHPTACCLG
jgi:hypothetical protein